MSLLTVIIKVTGACNIQCRHCYNAPKSHSGNIISFDVLKSLFRLTLSGERDHVLFIWHGGEPLLAGEEFYKHAMHLQHMYTPNSVFVENSLQTNGLLLTDSFERLLYKHRFRIGISYDGFKNSVLRDHSDEVNDLINRLISNSRRFGVLSTICSETVPYLSELYKEFNERQINWKFGPIFNSGRASENPQYLVNPKEYADEVISLMSEYVSDKNGRIRVSNLDSYLNIFLKKSREGCIYNSCMYRFISIEADGSLYPCGRYYPQSFRIGNVKDFTSISDIYSSPIYEYIVKQAVKRRNNCMHTCKWYLYCQGGCNNNALIEGAIEKAPVQFCIAFCKIISETIEILNRLDANSLDTINPRLRADFITFFKKNESSK